MKGVLMLVYSVFLLLKGLQRSVNFLVVCLDLIVLRHELIMVTSDFDNNQYGMVEQVKKILHFRFTPFMAFSRMLPD